MSTQTAAAPAPTAVPETTTAFAARHRNGPAVVRILFGAVWAVDAVFKWLPGFVHGQTLEDELGKGPMVHTPIIHQWIQLWHWIGTSHPQVFAVGIGVIETVVALALILGAFSNAAFIGSAILSFGIWSAAEGFHLPWSKPGMTDLGPSVGYIFASLALFYLAAGSRWSLDDRFLRQRAGRFAWLTSPKAS